FSASETTQKPLAYIFAGIWAVPCLALERSSPCLRQRGVHEASTPGTRAWARRRPHRSLYSSTARPKRPPPEVRQEVPSETDPHPHGPRSGLVGRQFSIEGENRVPRARKHRGVEDFAPGTRRNPTARSSPHDLLTPA